jgi:uncharacterized protein
MTLLNQTKNIQLVSQLEDAHTFLKRSKGLLGKKSIDPDYAMLIRNCKSIHTFFMNFPIDVAFIDKNFVVKKIYRNLKPGRLTLPILKAQSVIEFKSGFIHTNNVEVGDQLYVVH